MMTFRWFQRYRQGKPDPEAFIDEVARAVAPNWTDMDRYRDFRAVFLGNSDAEQGKRVLYEILKWGHMWRPSFTGDPYQAVFRDGERNVALRLLATMNGEPTAKPDTQQRRKKDG